MVVIRIMGGLMKKNIIALLLSIGACCIVSACTNPHSDDSSALTSSVTETSSEEATSCTITFKQPGQANIVRTVDKGATLENIPTPIPKTGYTITWDVTDFTNIVSNLTVNAVEIPNTYIVTYDTKGGTLSTATQDVVFDEATTLATPEKEGYLFLGWTYQGEAVLNGGKWSIAKNITLVATWQDNRPLYKVTFVDGTTATEVKVRKGDGVQAEDVPSFIGKVGYTPVWDTTELSNVQNDTTVTAVYTANTYTATYDADGYAIDGTTVSLTYDAVCSALDTSLTSDSHDFLGWGYGGATYTKTSVWNVADDVTLTAVWAEKGQYVLTFTDTNGSTITRTVYEGADLTDIPTPKDKVGYTVDKDNWYVDEDCTTVATFIDVQANDTFYAKATANEYTVTYDANGGSLATTSEPVTYDGEYTLPTPTHEKAYMRFDGWKNGAGQFVTLSGAWSIADDVTLTAVWTDTRTAYTVSFVQAGHITKTYQVKEGEAFTEIPACAKKKGYTVYWDETAIAKLGNVTENVEVVAIEEVKTFTVTLNAKGGSVATAKITVTYGEAYSLEAPTHDEYIFKNWYFGDVRVDLNGVWSIDSDAEEIVLVAKWGHSQWTGFY